MSRGGLMTPVGPNASSSSWWSTGSPEPTARFSSWSSGYRLDDLVDRAVGERLKLGVRAVLDGMGDEHAGNAAGFEVGDVVHTARRARASIGECLDHHVAGGGDLVAQVDRRGL